MVELEPGVLARCDGCRRCIPEDYDESVSGWIGDEAEGTRYAYCERCYFEAKRRWQIELATREIQRCIEAQPSAGILAFLGEIDWRVERQMIQEASCRVR